MTYLAKLLAAFHRQHPRVQYEIYSGDSDGITERIEQGLLDMGLLLEPVDTSRYQILRLPVRESWGVLVPEDSPLARREAVTPGDLADSPLILTTRELMELKQISVRTAHRILSRLCAAGLLEVRGRRYYRPERSAAPARPVIGVLLTCFDNPYFASLAAHLERLIGERGGEVGSVL